MTDAALRADPRYTRYQAEFFRGFVTEAGPGSVHLLLAPIGTGKSFVVAGSIAELMRRGRMQRVLILAPGALAAQWGQILSQFGQESVVVDGRILRLLREQIGSAADQWPIGIYAMSIDLAKRPDVHELLSAVSWDLVVVDEAHGLSGQRLQLVEDLAGKEQAPALLLATHTQGEATRAFTAKARVSDWGDAVAELETPPIQTTRRYRRSDEEVVVARQVVSSARELGHTKGMILLHRAASSISSLEDILVRWVEEPDQQSEHRDTLERLLEQVEQLRSDSRLECFINLLDELVGNDVRHVVVFCEYRETLEYLTTAVERLDFPDYALRGEMTAARISEVLDLFKSGGGILIATTAALQGVSLNFVKAAIHYDLPLSPAVFAIRQSRYDRYGSIEPRTAYFLEDETDALPLERLILVARKLDSIKRDISIDMRDLYREALMPQPSRDEAEEGR